MARVTVEDCIDKVESPYELVLVAKERATQLNSGIEPTLDRDNDKNTVIALREIAEDKVSIEDLKTNAVLRLRKEPNESDEEVVEEEISNDDFEKEYKGEVSKSGVAILPSKRMRKIPSPSPSISAPNSSEDENSLHEEESSPLELTEEVVEEKK